jgi:uncharacterized lipoprotein YajG
MLAESGSSHLVYLLTGERMYAMKKLLMSILVVALAGAMLVAGCEKKKTATTPEKDATTTAPAEKPAEPSGANK